METPRSASFGIGVLLLLCVATAPGQGLAQDDTDLFGSPATANVLLLIDNSRSMRYIVPHPSYDPNYVATEAICRFPSNTRVFGTVQFNQPNTQISICRGLITIYPDRRARSTFYSYHYLAWLFEAASPAVRTEVATYDNASYGSACLVDWAGTSTYSLYLRTRISVVKDVLGEIICAERNSGTTRIGLAIFREEATVNASAIDADGNLSPGQTLSTQGGYVVVPIRAVDSTTPYRLHSSTSAVRTHYEQLREAIRGLRATTTTPLSESLFQIYQYFMSRDPAQTVPGQTPGQRFPVYPFSLASGGSGVGNVPADPILADCQPNFVVLLTDGFPTTDTFTVPDSDRHQPLPAGSLPGEAQGWDRITDLVPDTPDYAGEVAGCQAQLAAGARRTEACYRRSGSGATGQYDTLLDDIAALMATQDFRPDLTGTQTIRTFTIAFATPDVANTLLAQTAARGNGLSFVANRVDEIRRSLEETFGAFRAAAQSFSGALVPAVSRGTGTSLFLSYFLPETGSAFWEGHLEHRQLTLAGDTGMLHWDAGLVLRSASPGSRDLRVSTGSLARGATLPELRPATVARTALFPTDADAANFGTPTPNPTGFDASDPSAVHAAVIHAMRGCEYPTRDSSCVTRSPLLGDIFHSRPVLVGAPRGISSEPSYRAFRNGQLLRERRVYAGANDGFLHAFDAGNRATALADYGAGSGAERFGFMPWPVRRAVPGFVRALSNGSPAHRFFVDGPPAASDAWFYNDNLAIRSKQADGSEWRTVLIGGLRRGGEAYYALDITNATGGGTPGTEVKYLWEFPREGGAHNAYVAQTWARPVIAKVKARYGGQSHERWVAVLNGGYQPGGDPHRAEYDPASREGRGIFLVDIKTGDVLGEKRFREISESGVNVGDPRLEMQYAIASAPAVFDTDSDEFADVIYVGDLGGNVWKWVIGERNDNYLADAVNDSAADVSQPNTTFHIFFSAKPTVTSSLGATYNGANYYHSFFYPPVGALRGDQLWLAMATGERADLQRAAGPDDAMQTGDNNRFYVVIDPNPYDALVLPPSGIRPAPPQRVIEDDLDDVTALTTCPSLSAGKRGYYFLAANGEKFSTDILLTRFQAYVGSYVPQAVTNPCGDAPGQSFLYQFRFRCGEGLVVGTDPMSRSGRRAATGGGAVSGPRRTVQLPGGSSRIYYNTSGDSMLRTNPGPSGYDEGQGQLYWRERRQ